jgi:uncharacterized protein YlxP (DUF503 family)
LETPGSRSLKEKRALILPITEKLKARFPVSVARLAGLEAHGWELIGVTAISHDPRWLQGMLSKVEDFVSARAQVGECSLEVELWCAAE